LFAFGSFGAMMALSYTSALLSNNYASYIRKNLFSHVNSLSADQISKLTVSSLITRNTSDSMKAANGFNSTLRIGISAPATAVGGIIKVIFSKEDGATTYSSTLPFGIIIGVGTVSLVLFFTFVAILLIPRFKKQVTYTDSLNRATRENISGIRVVRAFNTQEIHSNKYISTTKKIYKNDLFVYVCLNSAFPIIMMIVNFITIAIY
jgi:ATP-binding cassette subfamily B protein